MDTCKNNFSQPSNSLFCLTNYIELNKCKIFNISMYNKTSDWVFKYWKKDLYDWEEKEIKCLISLENKFEKILDKFKNTKYTDLNKLLSDFFENIYSLWGQKIYNQTLNNYEEFKKMPLEQQFYTFHHVWWKNSFWWDCNHAVIFYKSFFDKIWLSSKIVDLSTLENTNHTELLVELNWNHYILNLFNWGEWEIFKKLYIWSNVTSYNYKLINITSDFLDTDSWKISLNNNLEDFVFKVNLTLNIWFNDSWVFTELKSNHLLEAWKIYFNFNKEVYTLDLDNLDFYINILNKNNGLILFFKELTNSEKFIKKFINIILKINKFYFLNYLEKLNLEYKKFPEEKKWK